MSPADARGFSVHAVNTGSRPINGQCTCGWKTELMNRMDRIEDCFTNLKQSFRSSMNRNEIERNSSKQPTSSVEPTNDGVRNDGWDDLMKKDSKGKRKVLDDWDKWDDTVKGGNSSSKPKTSIRGPRCYNCHDCGHLGRVCPYKGTGKVKCYACDQMTDHISKKCPLRVGKKKTKPDSAPRDGRGGANDKTGAQDTLPPLPAKGNFQIKFIADSGASEHAINDKKAFYESKKPNYVVKHRSANKNREADLNVDCVGKVAVMTGKDAESILDDVYYSSDLSKNLFSLRKLADLGYGIYLDDKKIVIFDKVTRKTYMSGVYKQPDWLLEFKLGRTETAMRN